MSLASVITVIGGIRIVARLWVWRLIFLVFPALFILIAFLFLLWLVWRWWFWVRVIWYVLFFIFIWKFRWSCQWNIFCWSCQLNIFRWLCQRDIKSWLCQWNIKSWSNQIIDSTLRIDLTIRIDSTIRIYLTFRIDSTIKIDSTIRIDLTLRIDSNPRIIFPPKKIHSFKLRISDIVNVCLYLAHSYLRNLWNTVPRRKPIGAIYQPSRSSSRGKDRFEFIRCVGGRDLQIQKLWSFSECIITREVYPFTRIDVGNFSGDCFQIYYSNEVGRRVAIYGQRSINGSVKWLGVPAPFCDTGVACTDNLFFLEVCWEDRGTVETWALGNQPGVHFGGVDVPWRGTVPFRAVYLPRSP